MSLKRVAFRALNRALARAGLQLGRRELDFQDIFLDQHTKAQLIAALAGSYREWLAGQSVFQPGADYDIDEAVTGFFDAWITSPFRERGGGSRFNNLLWLSLIARSHAPNLIVDSGTFQGASAWALHIGSPDTPLYSFDIDHSSLKLRCEGQVAYVEQDWMASELPQASKVLAYFDDHLDQVMRLRQAIERRVGLVIFDDDFPLSSYYAMAPGPHVLPKFSFVLDESLVDGMELHWRAGGRAHSWIVDRAYLDSVKPAIAATCRLPNTSLITSIHQTPYRLVALKS